MLHTAATELAVSLAEAKVHLRVTANLEDALITSQIRAATEDAEQLMHRAVMPQKWRLALDGFPEELVLRRPPVTAVDSIQYADPASGALAAVQPADYRLLRCDDYESIVVPAFGKTWPTHRAQPQAVEVLFSAGYATADVVPEAIKAWIKLRLGALYENREAWTLGQKIEQNAHVDYLLDRYRGWV